MHDDLKRRLNWGKAATTRQGMYGLPVFLRKNIKIKICRIISFPVIFFLGGGGVGCRTW